MGTAPLNGFLQRLRKAMAAETLSAFSDSELIDRFLANHEEAAFQALLHRHGQMVLRVCRRILPDEQDVEDVFQATFLALASKAHAIRIRESLASWLQCNAYHIALDACKSRKRRRKHETVAAFPNRTPALADDVAWKELRSVLDDELARLPERLSAPLVLCYLEGLTQDEAAARLGQAKSTFRRNLDRAREILGERLTRRGITLSASLFALLLSECTAPAAAPAGLTAATTEAAAALAAGKTAAAIASARAILLAQGALQPGLSAKVKCVCGLFLMTILAGLGGAAIPGTSHPDERMSPPAPQITKAARIEPPIVAKLDGPETTERIEIRATGLVLHVEVQSELKLTEKQLGRIRDTLREAHERYVAENPVVRPVKVTEPGEPAEWANKLVQEKHKALQKALPEILTVPQARRLQQLERQAAGVRFFQIPENQ